MTNMYVSYVLTFFTLTSIEWLYPSGVVHVYVPESFSFAW